MAMDQFIKIGAIKGESQDKANKEQIDVLTWSWGMRQSGSFDTGGGGGGGKATVNELSFSKYVDTASAPLQLSLLKGTHQPEAVLLVRKAGDGQKDYIKITLTDVIVTSVNTGGAGREDRLTENVTLNFAKVKYEYSTQDAKGITKVAGTYTYNVQQNAAE